MTRLWRPFLIALVLAAGATPGLLAIDEPKVDDASLAAKLAAIRVYPTVLILDAEGIFRHRDRRGETIDKAVEELLAKTSTPETVKP